MPIGADRMDSHKGRRPQQQDLCGRIKLRPVVPHGPRRLLAAHVRLYRLQGSVGRKPGQVYKDTGLPLQCRDLRHCKARRRHAIVPRRRVQHGRGAVQGLVDHRPPALSGLKLITGCFAGDYIAYMSPTTKETRHADWKSLNFAGTVDWALDLQDFTSDDFDKPPERPQSGEGCTRGDDLTADSGDLCHFSCRYGFCPESLCNCLETGPMKRLPAEQHGTNVTALDAFDVDLNRL